MFQSSLSSESFTATPRPAGTSELPTSTPQVFLEMSMAPLRAEELMPTVVPLVPPTGPKSGRVRELKKSS